MKLVAFIFARSGSKGLPGKNIRPLGGKPLIAWSIEHALSVKRIERVFVSTDSEEIAKVARQYGAEVPFIRPAELAQDDSPEWLAWRHAVNYLRETTGELPKEMITVTDAHRSPYFNMVKTNNDGSVGLVNPPRSTLSRRQDAPLVYDIATVCYVANSEFVMTHNATFEGRVKAVYVPTERAIDIDTLLDFQIAESLLNIRENKL